MAQNTPPNLIGEVVMASHINSIEALRRMVAEQISREGATSSFMVRAGLLLEILNTRAAETELREALDEGCGKLGIAAAGADQPNRLLLERIITVAVARSESLDLANRRALAWRERAQRAAVPTPSGHAADCSYHVDQNPHECDCDADAANAAGTELTKVLEAAAPIVCGALCPSVKRTGEEWTHSELCQTITAALSNTGGGG